MSSVSHYVYLKLAAGKAGSTDLATNIIPLKATSVEISTSKTIPSLDVPFAGLLTGESVTAALDLGMASKSISISGFLLKDTIVKKFTKGSSSAKSVQFNPIELGQLIHSCVDSTGIQPYQAINELVFLYESNVDETYANRASPILIPFNYHSRGDPKELDNFGAILAEAFPTDENSEGLRGFIRSFSTTIDSTTIDVSFSLQFEVAKVFPDGKVATTIADAIS